MLNFKKGSLPQWDEQFRFLAYVPKDKQGHQTLNPFAETRLDPEHAAWSPVARQKRWGNLSVDDSLLVIAECLKDTQGYHLLDPGGSNWRVQFPYARYVKKGDGIHNLTTKEKYEVAEVINPKTNDVLLTGTTAPAVTDRLRLSEVNEIVLTHGYPRNFVNSEKIVPGTKIVVHPPSFNDTIPFLVR